MRHPLWVLVTSPGQYSRTVCRVSSYKIINTMPNTAKAMSDKEVLEYITKNVGELITDLNDVDVETFMTPFPIHLLSSAALEHVGGYRDSSGVVTLYWLHNKWSPEQLFAVSITIPGTELPSKPRVVRAMKVFKTIGGVPTATTTGKSISGMPEIPEGKILITSGIAASAASELGMTNVYAPGAQVKRLPDAKGRSLVIGCFGLVQGS